jgi:uncharacterized membrane protein YdbT with pleckstrin-like domain
VAPRLQPGERLLYEGHPSWRSALDLYAKGLALTAVAALLAAVATSLGGDRADQALVMIVALIGVAATLLGGLLKRASTSYSITDRRLHIKRGLLSRTVQDTRLQRVRNVNYRQTVLQRLLRIGDVEFDTAAGQEHYLVFSGVAGPAEIVDEVGAATPITSARRPEGRPSP